MLEASGFDFRVRYPHKHLIKLAKEGGIGKDVVKIAYDVMVDLYKTFAPLKQTCATMSFACLEFATLILEKQQENIRGPQSPSYRKWCTRRAEIMETLLDLLDLYTHFQKSSIVGPSYNIEKFIQLKIKLNQEIEEDSTLSRYTEQHEPPKTHGFKSNIKTPKTPITPASPSDTRINGNIASPATLSPRSSGSGRKSVGTRGQDGTIRFMLDAEQAKQEKETVAEYFKVEYEDYEIEVEEPIKPNPPQQHQNNPRNHHNRRDDRFHHHNKRMRR